MSVLEQIHERLRGEGIEFRASSHPPVYTSEEAARVRGVSPGSGAKALIVKAGDTFRMFVLPGDHKLDGRKIRRNLGYRNIRFATPEEVEQITGLKIGSIPPLGSLFGLHTICDSALGENEEINFNAGTHTDSICMAYRDYLKVEDPEVVDFSKG